MIRAIAGPLLITALLLPGPADAGRRALLIGIDAYADPAIPTLAGTGNDVRAMARFLEHERGFERSEIRSLLDLDATAEAIVGTIEDWLIAGTAPGDEVVLYYSGHGFQQPDEASSEEDDGLDETLVAADARPDGNGGFVNMVSDDTLAALLDRLGDRRVTVILDSCHSGTATRAVVPTPSPGAKSPPMPPGGRGARPVAQLDQDPTARSHRGERGFTLEETAYDGGEPWRVVWTAVSPAQLAYENDEAAEPGGVFTSAFLDGLEGAADTDQDGTVTRVELLDHVRAESEAFCSRKGPACPLGITPTLEAPRGLLWGPAVVPADTAADDPVIADQWRPDPDTGAEALVSTLLGKANGASVALTVEPASELEAGDEVRFRVESERPGQLILLDLNADLELRQLFPNAFAERGAVDLAPGRPVSVPGDDYGIVFEAGPPFGEGVVFAVVVEDELALAELQSRHEDFAAIETPQAYLHELAALLRTPWTGDAVNRAVRWSVAKTHYQIGP